VISKCENYFLSKVVSPVGDQTCDGVVFTSGYGYRTNPIDGSIQLHDGVDLAKEGGCIIKSVMSGSLSHESGYGNTVKIIHDTRFTTIYGHGSNYLNNPGQSISGDNIMYMGCTGQCTGTHLHFVVREGGDSFDYHTDPVPYFQRYFKLLYGFNE
jgi:murein DD-endopeptidase MepM/ murein hydrolase activator NlpD